MNTLLKKFNGIVDYPDVAKLVLRIGFSILFLLHGINKLSNGVAFIETKFISFGLPGFFAYAAYVGEVLVPVLLIIGLFTRVAAFMGVISSIVIIILMHSENFFTLTRTGGWIIEPAAVYLFAFLAIMLLGSGKYALKAD